MLILCSIGIGLAFLVGVLSSMVMKPSKVVQMWGGAVGCATGFMLVNAPSWYVPFIGLGLGILGHLLFVGLYYLLTREYRHD